MPATDRKTKKFDHEHLEDPFFWKKHWKIFYKSKLFVLKQKNIFYFKGYCVALISDPVYVT